MAGSLTFESSFEDDLHTYRYVACDDSVDLGPNELVAVYLGLIWRLTSGLERYGVPRYYREAGYISGDPFALVDWEYNVRDIGDGDPGGLAGFVPARSAVRALPPPSPWQVENAARAGLFELPVFKTLLNVLEGLLGDATAELNMYAAADYAAGRRIAEALQGAKPRMADLLSANELFIDVKIGVDHGYADVIVIQSHSDLTGRLTTLTSEYEAAIAEYEADVEGPASLSQFNERLAALLRRDEKP